MRSLTATKGLRDGKAAVQAIVVGVATAIGGAIAVPQMMTNMDSSRPAASATSQSIHSSEKIAQSRDSEVPHPSPAPIAKLSDSVPAVPAGGSAPPTSFDSEVESSLAAPHPKSVQVFFATDRSFVRASDYSLWAKTIIPSCLAIAIVTILLLQAIYAQSRRWIWWTVFSFCALGACYISQQAIVKSGQLYRMARLGGVWFASQRYESGPSEYPLHLGVSEVSLPENRDPGELPTPSIFKLEFSERADRHVVIQKIDRMTTEEFFLGVNGVLHKDPSKSAFVFIHGYNVVFDDAMRRTAQIAADIRFKGPSILYSWPSGGKLLSYTWDESSVAWSVTHLERFLLDLREKTGVKQIHLVAHSMGNRALLGALERLALRFPNQQPMFGQVVLAAPDVDTDDFLKRYASSVSACAKRATLYASSSDRALLASMKIHGYRRLGLTSAPQPTVEGVDVVDVSPIDTSLLGHSYYGNHPLMIRELRELIDSGTGPIDREWLMTAQESQTPPLWKFRIPELTAQTPALMSR